MTEEILLTISGIHTMEEMEAPEGHDEPIEVITPASYYWKNGKHFILYDEMVEGVPGVIRNRIKINGDQTLEIHKSGITNANMVFEKDKMSVTYYETPYGQIQVGIHTRQLNVDVRDDRIDVRVEYGLDVNHEALADCRIHMNIRPKHAAESVFR